MGVHISKMKFMFISKLTENVTDFNFSKTDRGPETYMEIALAKVTENSNLNFLDRLFKPKDLICFIQTVHPFFTLHKRFQRFVHFIQLLHFFIMSKAITMVRVQFQTLSNLTAKKIRPKVRNKNTL